MNEQKPKERWITGIDDGYNGIFSEKPDFLYSDIVHIIEYSAYEQAIKERDEARAEVKRLHDKYDLQLLVQQLTEKNQLLDECEKALEYYANHESLIKEAYHSNNERQITVVHTFINHVAREALAKLREGRK